MKLEEARRRLPIVDQLAPPSRDRSYLPAAPDEMPRPKLAVWEFTLACDQACVHCGPRAADARDDELSTDEALALVEQLHDLGVGEVTLIGGEAYLRNDFLLVIRRIRELGMIASMTTGGYGLTRRRAEAMVEAGISTASVSIDGLEAHHDRLRDRPGSWRRAFEALAHLRAAGSQIAANSQINAINLGDHPELLEFIAAAGCHSWQLQFTIPHGNGAEHPDLVLQPYQLLEVYRDLERIIPRARELGVRLWPANNLGYFGPLESQLRRDVARPPHFKGCSAGTGSIGIESNGEIKACPTLGGPTNLAGNVRDWSLAELWARAPEITYFRRRGLDELWGFCRSCYYAATCMAGCSATTEPIGGRPGNNPYCFHRALEREREGLRERMEPALAPAPIAFANGAFRLILESSDPATRSREGPVEVVEPRVSRLVEEMGGGSKLPSVDADLT